MPETLYRSHSLEKSQNGISGSLTLWEDAPVSPFDVGDTFYPVQDSPALVVDKVSIKDNVIGELNGKLLRQWEISIEGSNGTQQETHIKYNFNISPDGKSGTMEVINKGDNPALSLEIGDSFSVPGIGEVTCSNVRGSNDYDDNGVHTWTVIYEGTDTQSTSIPETKYSLAIQKDDDGDIQKSGSMSVVNEGDAPTLSIQVGSKFSVPGLGSITCTKVSGNDDYTETGAHRWTMTYEGVIDSEGSGGGDDNPDDTNPNAKYSFSIEKDSSSGSVEFTTTGTSPSVTHSVGSKLTLPGIGEVTCTKVSGSDSYSDSGKRRWTIVYEGSNNSETEQDTSSTTKYSLSIEKNSDGITVYSGSKEITCTGSAPTISLNVGQKFSLPLVGELICTRVHSTNDDDTWMVIYEGSRGGEDSSGGDGDDTSLPENETVINYEINGETVRTVAGELIALQRSNTPITKKTITVYNSNVAAVATAGSTYQGGIVLSENISKETIKNNGVVTGSYYKHVIEVEA